MIFRRATEYESIGGHAHAVPTCNVDKAMMRLARYEDTEREPEEVEALSILFEFAVDNSATMTQQLELIDRIRELAEADKNERVVVLPCKVGDTVYRLQYVEQTPGRFIVGITEIKFGLIWLEEFGKTVFLTREEAESALEVMKDE